MEAIGVERSFCLLQPELVIVKHEEEVCNFLSSSERLPPKAFVVSLSFFFLKVAQQALLF